MPLQLAPELKEKTAAKWIAALSRHLLPGEIVWALARTSSFRPLFDGLAVTNTRILAFCSGDVATKGPRIEVQANEISHFNILPTGSSRRLILSTLSQGEVSLGLLTGPAADFVSHYLHHLAPAGHASAVNPEAPTQPSAPLFTPPTPPPSSMSPTPQSPSVSEFPPLAKKMSKGKKVLLWAGAVVVALIVISIATSPDPEEEGSRLSNAGSPPTSPSAVTAPAAGTAPPSPQPPPPAAAPVAPKDPADMVPGVDYPPDDVFILNLQIGDVYYSSEENAIQVAKMTCDKLSEGIDPIALQIIAMEAGGYSAYDAGYFMGAAVNAYCPEYEHLLN